MAEAVKVKRPKLRKDKDLSCAIDDNIPDVPVLEEFLSFERRNEIDLQKWEEQHEEGKNVDSNVIPEIGTDATILNPGDHPAEVIPVGGEMHEEKQLNYVEPPVTEPVIVIEHQGDRQTPYSQLLKDVSKFIDEETEPTVPLEGAECASDYLADVSAPSAPEYVIHEDYEALRAKLEIIEIFDEETEVEEEQAVQIANILDKFNIYDEMKDAFAPLAVNELREFYDNEEIPLLPEYIKNFTQQVEPSPSELYELLLQYIELYASLEEANDELKKLKTDFSDNIANIWTYWPDVTLTEKGICGDSKEVIFYITYPSARLNNEVLDAVHQILIQGRCLAFDKISGIELNLRLTKEKIVVILSEIAHSCSEFEVKEIPKSMKSSERHSYFQECVFRLRSTISTLFYFLRKIDKVNHDSVLVNHLWRWQCELIAILLSIASWQDHIFLLSHVLRCPEDTAISACKFIQCPESAYDHPIALLSVLLQPVDKREIFLKNAKSSEPWVMVDSEGEDEITASPLLKENLLIAVFNQINLIPLLEKYIEKQPSEYSQLQLMAMLSSILDILHQGLTIYKGEQHRQFAKMLGKLIKQLVTIGTNTTERLSPSILSTGKIQKQYNALFLKAARALLVAPANWQFLSSIPSHLLSNSGKWALFFLLQLTDSVSLDKFEQTLAVLQEAEQIFLLRALSSLVLGDIAPQKLVRCVALEIFYIGFISERTRDICYKNTKPLLVGLALKYDFMLSELLKVQDKYFDSKEAENQSLTIALWSSLPVSKWVPSQADFALLIKWVMSPADSSCNEVGRCIFKLIDFKLLPWDIQKRIAKNLLAVHSRHIENHNIVQWTWFVMMQLRLHLAEHCSSVAQINSFLHLVPDLSTDGELGLRVEKKESIAVYVALSTTLLGHSAPILYYQGFSSLKVLMNDARYEAMFQCLSNMVTMFFENSESLYTCESFLALLNDVTTLDNTYFKRAKNLIVTEFPGRVLRKFAMMLHHHLSSVKPSNLCKAVILWLGCLCKVPSWQHNNGVVFLLDIICRHAFFRADAWHCVLKVLEDSITAISPSEPKSPLSSIINWMGTSTTSVTSLLPRGCNGDAPWFAYAAISVQFDVLEKRTQLWQTLQQELSSNVSVDTALKRASAQLKMPVRSYASLAFYHWAAQALETPLSNPVSVFIWQKLLELYLCRVPGLIDRGSVGSSFFKGSANSSLLKRLQAHLNTEKLPETSIFSTFSFWLSEPLLLEPRLLVASLPVHYQPSLLSAIFEGNSSPWIQFFDFQEFDKHLQEDANLWVSAIARKKNEIPPLPELKKDDPFSSLMITLKELENKRLEPPERGELWMDYKRWINFNDNQLSKSLYDIKSFVKLFEKSISSAREREELILALSKNLYLPTVCTQVLSNCCDGVMEKGQKYKKKCIKAATLPVQYEMWKKNSIDWDKFTQICTDWSDNLNSKLEGGYIGLCGVWKIVMPVVRRLEENKGDQIAGVKLFFKILQYCNTKMYECPVVRNHLLESLKLLGKICIAGNAKETANFYNTLSENMFSSALRSELFTPWVLDPATYVKLYDKAVKSASCEDVGILPDFRVSSFLAETSPRLVFRSELIESVFTGFKIVECNEDSIFSTTLNEHLLALVSYDFPEHYGEVLQKLLLTHQRKPWLTFLQALCPPNKTLPVKNGIFSLKKTSAFICAFSVDQTLLSTSDILNTSLLLGPILLQEKCLYKKFRSFAEPFFVFIGMLVQGYVIKLMQTSPSILSSLLVEQIWSVLDALFSPWLVPKVKNCHIIQPFTDDDAQLANFCVTIFIESIRFMWHNLPGTDNILSFTWRWYTTNFCKKSVDGLVLSTVHSALVTLPWSKFNPDLQDVECMLMVINDYLPLCHSFLGNVFVSIDWNQIVTRCGANDRLEKNARLLSCLLHLFVKVPSEPSLKLNRVVQLHLSNAMSYPWYLVDSNNYGLVLNWVSTVCSSSIVINDPSSDYRDIDNLVLRLLQTAAGYHSSVQYFHPTTATKRQMFVATVVKCLATENSRRKRGLSKDIISNAVKDLLSDIEVVITATVPEESRMYEASLILAEVLKLLTESSLSSIVEESILQCIRNGKSPLLIQCLIRYCGLQISNPIIYGAIIEACIDMHFVMGGCRDWKVISEILEPFSGGSVNVDQVLISNSCILTFYALIKKRLSKEPTYSRKMLVSLLQMFATFKTSEESEPKVILLVGLTILLAQEQPDAVVFLLALSKHLNTLSNDRTGGILSSLGLKKNVSPTIKLKGTCLVINAGINSILINKYQQKVDDRFSAALDKIENTKVFQPILANILAVRPAICDLSEARELVSLLYTLAAQVFTRLYLTL